MTLGLHCCGSSFIMPYIPRIHTVVMTLGIHCCDPSLISPYVPRILMVIWWPWVYNAVAHNSLYLMYPGYTQYSDDPGYTLLGPIIHYTLCTHDTHSIIMTLGIHCCNQSLISPYVPRILTVKWWLWVYTDVAHHSLYLMYPDTHSNDDPGYSLL